MNQKTTILFAIDSLHCAGAEKSLVTLLSLLDYERYDVELQLFGYGGVLEELVPKRVKFLPPFEYIEFTKKPLKRMYNFGELKYLQARLRYSIALRKQKYSN
ncbi:MAG: glycosyltransferase, partial [Culicoidibacterales bacterium]